jgi:hypothetical protein
MSFRSGSTESEIVLTVGNLRAMIKGLPDDMPVRINTGEGSCWAEKALTYEDTIGYAGRTMDCLLIGAERD